MRVLNIEDNAIKHTKITRMIRRSGINDIDWAKSLKDGFAMLEYAKNDGKPYDLVVTDMYYPLEAGSEEVKAGEIFIQKMEEVKDNTPIILCSNVNYKYPQIYGNLYYSDRSNWEEELENYLNALRRRNRK